MLGLKQFPAQLGMSILKLYCKHHPLGVTACQSPQYCLATVTSLQNGTELGNLEHLVWISDPHLFQMQDGLDF